MIIDTLCARFGIILEEYIDDNCGVEFIPEEKLELH